MSTPDFSRNRLDAMIDLHHPLAVLATRMPWVQIEATLSPVFAHRIRDGQSVAGEDLFGPTLAVAGGGVSAVGRPRLPIRLMVGLLYLKHAWERRLAAGEAATRETLLAAIREGAVQRVRPKAMKPWTMGSCPRRKASARRRSRSTSTSPCSRWILALSGSPR